MTCIRDTLDSRRFQQVKSVNVGQQIDGKSVGYWIIPGITLPLSQMRSTVVLLVKFNRAVAQANVCPVTRTEYWLSVADQPILKTYW